jgi:polar amino acid transport system substrate-binding protein
MTMMTKARGILWLLTAALVFLGGSASRAESTLDKVKSSGVLLAGVRYDFPPMGTVDADGKPIGFGVDLSKIIADKLGVKVKYIQTTSSTRIPLLLNGSIDADFGPTTPTVKREEVVDFTIPYIWDTVTLIVKKGASPKIADYAPPKKLTTTQGSANIDVAKEALPSAQFLLLQEYPDTVAALLNGKADAIVTNRSNAVAVVEKYPSLALGTDFFHDPWAIAVRENDSQWRKFLNHTLQELWKTGQYQALYSKWFHEKPEFPMWSEYKLQPGI